MNKRSQIVSIYLILAITLLVACTPVTAPTPAPQAPAAPARPAAPVPITVAPAQTAWEAKWEKVLEEGGKEGKVVVYSSAGGPIRVKTMEAFMKQYDIDLEWVGLNPAETSVKILSERRAGIYMVDHYLGGTTTPVTLLKPKGALEPLETAFILPDITNPELIKKLWWKEKLSWVDRDHTVLAVTADAKNPITYNTEMVKAGEIKSYKDLLTPKFKDKITIRDPSRRGGGSKWFSCSIIAGMIDENYMRELAKQNPWISADARLQMDWVARGKFYIALGADPAEVKEFLDIGAPISQMIPKEGTYASASHGGITLMNKAPHLNAAKVFINWFLSKEGQTAFNRAMGSESRRLDVPTDYLLPSQIRQPGVEYFDSEWEDVMPKYEELQALARKIFNIK